MLLCVELTKTNSFFSKQTSKIASHLLFVGGRLHLEREFDVRFETSIHPQDLRNDDPARVPQRNGQPGKEVHRLRRHRGEKLS